MAKQTALSAVHDVPCVIASPLLAKTRGAVSPCPPDRSSAGLGARTEMRGLAVIQDAEPPALTLWIRVCGLVRGQETTGAGQLAQPGERGVEPLVAERKRPIARGAEHVGREILERIDGVE